MGKHKFSIADQQFEVEVGTRRGTTVPVAVNGKSYTVELDSEASAMALRATPSSPPPAAASAVAVAAPAPAAAPKPAPGGAGAVIAPMAGMVLSVKVKVGDAVEAGATLVVLEAMKMENAIGATSAGTVKNVAVQAQQTVNQGDLLVELG